MRTPVLALPAPILLLLGRLARAEIENDFSAYPEGSQPCLYDAADASQCTGDTGQEMNECLCGNGGNFVYNTANCVAQSSPSDLETVYETLSSNCAGTGVTISVSKAAFMAQASAATAATTTSTPTATASSTTTTTTTTSSTSSDPDSSSTTTTATQEDSGLTTGAKIGIGVGVGFGAIALGLLGWFVWAYSRRRRRSSSTSSPAPGDESNYGATPRPAEYAQQNAQTGAAELGGGGGGGGNYHDNKNDAGQEEYYEKDGNEGGGGVNTPLLAELGGGDHSQQQRQQQQRQPEMEPVELPADGFLHSGYVAEGLGEQQQQNRISQGSSSSFMTGTAARVGEEEGVSPATRYSQTSMRNNNNHNHNHHNSSVSPFSSSSSSSPATPYRDV
ncbi:hypothetical protein F4778DRAFT_136924 [Xylariomycetidae sp. FL2044]|nr:hypothetical protein F4778DRAFT_136924 [Xylariomycetidae sp. FL2044]